MTPFSRFVREEKMVKCEIMIGQSLHEYPRHFLTNIAISMFNLRGSFWMKKREPVRWSNTRCVSVGFQLKGIGQQRLPRLELTDIRWPIVFLVETTSFWILTPGENKGLVNLGAHCHGFVPAVARERQYFIFPYLFYFGLLYLFTNLWGSE